MSKVEIDIPKGKIADITKDGDRVIVTFKEKNVLDRLRTFEDVLRYLEELANNEIAWAKALINEYNKVESYSYSEAIIKYHMVVAALTNNEQRHLTTSDRWFPVIQFCEKRKKKNCWGDKIVGYIISEGIKYAVVGGFVAYGSYAGLCFFHSKNGMSYSSVLVGYRSVSSEKVAKHISTYFGKLLFTVHYGGVNCDWQWVD